MISLTPAKRVELALRNKIIDKVPFAVFDDLGRQSSAEWPVLPYGWGFLHQCSVERELRNMGLCIIYIRCWGYKAISPNVKVFSTVYEENNKLMFRTDYKTPLGDLYSINGVSEETWWSRKKLFTCREDYKIFNFMINDVIVQSDNDNISGIIKFLGEDFFLRGSLGLEPLQALITGNYFTVEQFCIEWMENRDEILKLYDSMFKLQRKVLEVAANSPLFYFCTGGNLIPEVMSPENFKKYYMPYYEEAAEIFQDKDKILGCHYDADLGIHKDLIAATPLDVIESFNPSPDTDMTVTEARKIFKDKILWLNFPSSVHLKSQEEIARTTSEIIDEAGDGGWIMGIIENVPQDRWQKNYMTIMKTIDKKFKG
jgi:hypothetical protein